MRTFTLIAVDDEPLILKLVEKLCSDRGIRFLKGFTSALEARAFLAANAVDIVVLDIEMPGMSGLELATAIQPPTKFIFSTSHDHFAMEAFNLSATDYLLKPYTSERFATAIEKAGRLIALEERAGTGAASLTLKSNYSNTKVVLDHISYIESIDNYVIVYRDGEEPLKIRSSLKALLEDLPADRFLRIHRSYVVPFARITGYRKAKIIVGNKELPLSASYRESVLKAIAQRG